MILIKYIIYQYLVIIQYLNLINLYLDKLKILKYANVNKFLNYNYIFNHIKP